MRPLRDNVVLRRIPYEHPSLAVVGVKLNKGIVVAIGPGKRIRRLVHYRRAEESLVEGVWLPDGAERVKRDGKPLVRPMRVAVGDVVEFSPNQHTIEFELDGERLVLISEQSIYWKDRSGSRSEAILAQRPAGWERGRNGAADTFLAR